MGFAIVSALFIVSIYVKQDGDLVIYEISA